MNRHGLYHVLDVPYAYAKDKDTLIVKLRTARNDIKKCSVRFRCRYEWQKDYERKEMEVVAETELFTYYETELHVDRNRYRYYFELEDNNGEECLYTERGAVPVGYANLAIAAFQFPYIAEEDIYEGQKWLQESTVYQIFPDRFCNGNPEKVIEGMKPWGEGKVTGRSIYGGDIKGITKNLDYLENLGIDLIYLTPIFKSTTNHKYNTADYFEIDPAFGTLEDVKELVEKSHKKGIKIILDAVFNHSGSDFFAFKDVLENQENSKYKDWYLIDSYPVSEEACNYYTFANGCENMPKLNTKNQEVTEYLLKVARYWVEEIDVDGWRLDVCDEVSHEFWRAFRKAVKSAKGSAIIIGEIMHEANNFLKGDQLDTIMNYPFKNATIDFFGKHIISAQEYLDILAENRMIYMNDVTKQMWNLVGSHDTKRILDECNYNVDRMKMSAVMQFTYIGVPYIYYGDEIGMEGLEDPDNRRCMIWDESKHNKELFNLHKDLIRIRKENKSLIHGDFKIVYNKDEVIAFTREYNGEKILVVFNNNEEEYSISYISENCGLDLITNEKVDFSNRLKLNKLSFKIIKL